MTKNKNHLFTKGKLGIMLVIASLIVLSGCQEPYGDITVPECASDAECVPATCCHASECVHISNAPDCEGMFCSMECVDGTMDCGQGRCVCDNGVCKAQFN